MARESLAVNSQRRSEMRVYCYLCLYAQEHDKLLMLSGICRLQACRLRPERW